ncbi:hypothetical protein [Bacillus atrophaeus]|uniref:hypothetical protein n=1 Tax=Bacillus atrophaeus TaxID=1452 RepID=UPI002DB9B356|nr:hypothetical protein [Bacillus atrophaeus]MEC1900980.1 hypothetical protein [Bacillus atrophaeus]MEC2396145.1 hypothetical protein [Bacillus atrophaeus]MED4437317.1 hypothetical protein [Bacillus atrophaeus]MED4567061.1 hypothetical protein [Bacillus atrophaeus]MED4573383.1 hypothetical protein [Bacillus atrophaeus]
MKKLFKSIILSAVLLTGAAVVAPSASAVWSGYQTSKKVRVYTDSTNYSGRATSVDWKAQKTTSGRVYYDAMLIRTDNFSNTGVQRGNFTSSTPLKKFSLSKARPGTYQVVVNIYTDKAERKYVGTVRSAKIYIKR